MENGQLVEHCTIQTGTTNEGKPQIANPIESEEVFHTYMALAEHRKSQFPGMQA
jgi:hypothetical protein